MKKFLLVVICILSSVLFLACGGEKKASSSDKKDEAKTIRVSFNQTEAHPQFKALTNFSKRVKERTNGKFNIEVFPNELLGPQRESIELVQSGAVDMAIISIALMENYDKKFSILNLPYLFESKEHQVAVIKDKDITDELYKITKDQGFMILTSYHAGSRSVYTKTGEIKDHNDLSGLKIRIMQSQTNIKMMDNMGGVGTPMGQGEVYTAIQQGILDGAENNELVYSDLKHAEVAPHFTYTEHLMILDSLIINSSLYDSLTEDEKVIFQEELDKSLDEEVELWTSDINRAKAEAEKSGAKFYIIDKSKFLEKAKELHEDYIKDPEMKKLYDKVKAKAL